MNKSQKILQFTALFFLPCIFLSLQRQNDNPETIISERYKERQQQLTESINALRVVLKTRNKKQIVTHYGNLRRAFKRWEYLAEYKHPALFREKINGAPLPKMEENAFGAIIIQPTGLQVMDEWMGDLNSDSFLLKMDYLSSNLLQTVRQIPDNPICYDHEIFEAGRLELVRLFTLGLTGFDSPGTLSSLEDAKTVLKTLNEDFLLFLNDDKTTGRGLKDTILTAFNYAEKMLNNQRDFNKFNRAEFLIRVINPLYTSLLDLQTELQIPYPKETRSTPAALEYKARLLFADNFLDPAYYSGLPSQFRTEEVKKLGMLLFFDPVLSDNNQRACASCHKPELAFTDGQPKSIATGFSGTVNRNSPSLINCVFSERFFHDLRAEALEDQMTHVIADAKEFNTSQHKIVEKLLSSSEYKDLFNKAFAGYGTSTLNPQTISFAISAYVGSLNSFNSVFDKYARGEISQIDDNIVQGFNLFMGKAACGTCHFAPLFSGTVPPDFTESESEVLGIPESWPTKNPISDKDPGRTGGRLKEQVDIYRQSFKTPGIRNIQKTAPYMHNGGMKTLDAVMDFYNKGGGNGIGLHFSYQTLSSDKLNLTKKEITQIIAFLNSLTDCNRFNNKPLKLPKFSDSNLNTRKIGGEY